MTKILADVLDQDWKDAIEQCCDEEHAAELLGLYVDSHVGEKCVKLSEVISKLDALGLEQDNLDHIKTECAESMAVWLFG